MSRVSILMNSRESNTQELSQMQMDDENMPQISRVMSSKGLADSQPRPRQSLTRARSALTDINNNAGILETQRQRQSLPHQQSQQGKTGGQLVRPLKIHADKQEPEHSDKRVSLKRQATDSSSDFLEQGTQEVKKVKVEHDYTWDDLDADDADDPLMVSEYVNDIFEYLHELELKTLPDPNYLHWQRNLRPKMRSILVDWMVEVHLKFRLLPETLYLAINIMDRFMSRESVQVDRLQLLATGSLFIAAKYEEVYSPSVKNYAYVTDGGFTEEEILNAEKFILEILQFNMSYPNPMNFLRRISKADDYDVQSRTIGKYLLEISIIDHKFIGYLPSLCSAAAMYIARKMLSKNDWNGNLIHYSGGYKESDLKEVSEMIIDYLISPIVHEEFFKKYASRKFMKVSILARQWAKKITSEGKNIMDPML
ncbi:hypothetical protein KL935_001726 [Ogataea polymorpha]|uniref:Cyclin N-terminal domain-containing protein n=1 Tax=Ogataea polymorpha TaxID=460523 RepID=A0A9P8TCV8_9ASCO|nr:hypothetical protein KL935_001726 [Ogataea polymorpha]KAG7910800.1 hypothetical protein KL906_001180 [Ogataea polymorpha]KAH3674089.1 hypothetical protein OGATHE_002069 [Ogataea polymorpha]